MKTISRPLACLGISASWLCVLAAGLAPATRATEAASARGTTAGTAALSGRVLNIATGQYLTNARVAVRGTSLVAFTDETGTYRLNHLPAGAQVLEVSYTGLDPQAVAIDAGAGRSVVRDFELTSVARYGDAAAARQLDAFTVSASRETDGDSIAINEQRFAPNIKNVVAADSLGDVMDGNVGEFLKFLPGVVPEYAYEDGSTVSAVSVRGFAPGLVNVTVDGEFVANNSRGATGDPNSRAFSFNQASMNNISRIEVTKVPTPANPADSLSGSVNMVSKSAFERKSAQFRYNVGFAANSENFTWRREPHTSEERIHKVRPSANFDLTLPLGSRFGIVMTGSLSDRYAKLHYSYNTFTASAAGTGATPAVPFLSTYRLLDSPRLLKRQSIGLKADWKVTRNSVLSFGGQMGHFVSDRIATEFSIQTGTNPAPTVAGGQAFSYGDDFTAGAMGRGRMTMGGAASVYTVVDTHALNLRYRYDNGSLRVQAGADTSRANGGYRDTEMGRWRQMAISLRNPGRVTFRGIGEERPATIEMFDPNNRPIDFTDPSLFQLTTVQSTPGNNDDRRISGFANVRRDLAFIGVPAAVELGTQIREQRRDRIAHDIDWTYNGINGDRSILPYISSVYTGQYHWYGFRGFPHVSPKLAYQAFQANPALFTQTRAQIRDADLARINASRYFEERVTAGYAQTEFTLFRYRLKVLTGVRYEKTDGSGRGVLVDLDAPFVRNADGTFAHNAAGQRIRKPGAGQANSLDEVAFTHIERGAEARRSFDGYFPSLHLNYNLREHITLRAAYAQTYGRPEINNLVPTRNVSSADLDEDELGDPSVLQGTISMSNPGLRPWTAHNYDLSAEYYTRSGGMFSAGVFLKDVSDFFGSSTFVATAADLERLGFDSRYAGWRVTTTVNSGSARVTGAEVNVNQSLRELGAWGRHFSVFANATKLHLSGSRTADFTTFTPESLNWGFKFTRRPAMFMAKWSYRGKRQLGAFPALGPDAYSYDNRRLTLDLNAEVQLRKTIFLYANAQNVFNAPSVTLRYGSETPDYAKRYLTGYNGVGLTFGIKGTY